MSLKPWFLVFQIPGLSRFSFYLSDYRTFSSFACSSSSCCISGGVLPNRVLDRELCLSTPFKEAILLPLSWGLLSFPGSPSSLHPLSFCGAVRTHHVGNGPPSYCALYVLCVSLVRLWTSEGEDQDQHFSGIAVVPASSFMTNDITYTEIFCEP